GGGGGHKAGTGEAPAPGHAHSRSNGSQTVTLLNVLNATTQTATVTFTFIPHDGTAELVNPSRTVAVGPNARMGVSFLDLDFDLNDMVGVKFTSDQVVTVAAMITGRHRSAAIPAITQAATQWGFGEGFLTPERAGLTINEHL